MINNKELNKVREEIDKLDKELLKIIEDRFEQVKKVAEIKEKNSLPIRDLDREKEVIEKKKELTNLRDEFIEKLYQMLIDEASYMEGER